MNSYYIPYAKSRLKDLLLAGIDISDSLILDIASDLYDSTEDFIEERKMQFLKDIKMMIGK